MNTERKATLDKASSQDLWSMLAGPALEPEEALYIRDCLTRKSQLETARKLENIITRLQAVEAAQSRSGLSTLTFWLALLAAGFASFSVPWDQVKEAVQRWEREFQQTGRPSYRASAAPVPKRVDHRASPEPSLPLEDPSSPLADALLLLPRTDAAPQRFPEL